MCYVDPNMLLELGAPTRSWPSSRVVLVLVDNLAPTVVLHAILVLLAFVLPLPPWPLLSDASVVFVIIPPSTTEW